MRDSKQKVNTSADQHLRSAGLFLLLFATFSCTTSENSSVFDSRTVVKESTDSRAAAPKLFLFNKHALHKAKLACKNGEKDLCKSVKNLIAEAGKYLSVSDCFVTDKKSVPPSGDKHDYVSINTYLWPDPDKKDGLPYIHKDGQENPSIEKTWPDRRCLLQIFDRSHLFGLAWYLSDDIRYAKRHRRLIRSWFLDTETRMNPHLSFAQGHPGRNDGQAVGIVDISLMPRFLESLALLRVSPVWTASDEMQMNRWLGAMLEWLVSSEFGSEEEAKKNNHGTRYDSTVIAMALAVDRPDLAKSQITKVTTPRIRSQIQPDGSQPHELRRTKSLGYSLSNCLTYLELASYSSALGIDLWDQRLTDNPGIKRAVKYIAPYLVEQKKWPYQQIKPIKERKAYRLFKISKNLDKNPAAWDKYIQNISSKVRRKDFSNILY